MKYTVRKLFSKPYFSHPFEIILINQEDIIEENTCSYQIRQN